MRVDAAALRRHPDGRRLASMLFTVQFLEGKSIDGALKLFNLLMSTDEQQDTRQSVRTPDTRTSIRFLPEAAVPLTPLVDVGRFPTVRAFLTNGSSWVGGHPGHTGSSSNEGSSGNDDTPSPSKTTGCCEI